MHAKIILAATHSKLTKVRDTLAIEDGINALKVEFQFRTKDWDNTVKTAQFVRGCATPSTPEDDIISVLLDENNECNVPPEVLENKGVFSVGVWGVKEGLRIPSNWMYYRIADGCFAQGSTSLEPTPSVYEQIITALGNKSNSDHNHDDRYLRTDDVLDVPVKSVNNKIGDVMLTAKDVGAFENIVDNGVQIPTVPYSAIINPPPTLTQEDVTTQIDNVKDEINTTINNLNITITNRVNKLEDNIGNTHYTKREVDEAFADYYTQEEIENMFNMINGTSTLDAGKIIEGS